MSTVLVLWLRNYRLRRKVQEPIVTGCSMMPKTDHRDETSVKAAHPMIGIPCISQFWYIGVI